MSDQPKQLRAEDGTPIELKCPKCGNTDPVLFDHLEDEPIRREAKLVRDNGTMVFEGLVAQHYYEASTNERLECRNQVAHKPGAIASTCGTEIPMPAGIQLDFE